MTSKCAIMDQDAHIILIDQNTHIHIKVEYGVVQVSYSLQKHDPRAKQVKSTQSTLPFILSLDQQIKFHLPRIIYSNLITQSNHVFSFVDLDLWVISWNIFRQAHKRVQARLCVDAKSTLLTYTFTNNTH